MSKKEAEIIRSFQDVKLSSVDWKSIFSVCLKKADMQNRNLIIKDIIERASENAENDEVDTTFWLKLNKELKGELYGEKYPLSDDHGRITEIGMQDMQFNLFVMTTMISKSKSEFSKKSANMTDEERHEDSRQQVALLNFMEDIENSNLSQETYANFAAESAEKIPLFASLFEISRYMTYYANKDDVRFLKEAIQELGNAPKRRNGF